MKISLKYNSKNNLMRLFLALWSSSALLPLCFTVLRRIPIIGLSTDILQGIFWAIMIIPALGEIASSLRRSDIIFAFLLILIVLFQIAFPSAYSTTFIDEWQETLLKTVPYFFIGLALNLSVFTLADTREYKVFMIATYINLAVDVIFYILYSLSKTDAYTYIEGGTNVRYTSYMYFAYFTIPHVMVMLYDYKQRKKLLSLIAFLLGCLVVTTQGTRGAVVCVLVYSIAIIWQSIASAKPTSKLLILFLLAGLSGVLLFTPVLELFAKAMQEKIYDFGLSTRVFDAFLQADYIGDSGRSELFSKSVQIIKEVPIFGYGLTGDIGLFGQYSHDLFLELLIEFGIFVGSALIVTISVVLIRACIHAKKTDRALLNFLLIFVSIGFIKLFMSGSYLTEEWFFFLMGLCVQIYRTKIAETRYGNPHFETAWREH